MNDLTLNCSQMIAKSGSAKSMFIQAIREARKNNLEAATDLMKKGNENLLEGHRIHARLIQKEAQNDKVEINLLLVHAEDQMNSAEIIQNISEEFIVLYKEKSKEEY